MKSIKVIVASLIVAALAAFGGQAQAQTIPLTYKATNGTPFSVETAQTITGLPGSVNVVDETGFPSTYSAATLYTDSSYQVYTQITTDPVFLAKWLQVSAAGRKWANPTAIRNVTCYASKTTISYKVSGVIADTLADNCAFYSAYQARTN